jgi:hypothetical protein
MHDRDVSCMSMDAASPFCAIRCICFIFEAPCVREAAEQYGLAMSARRVWLCSGSFLLFFGIAEVKLYICNKAAPLVCILLLNYYPFQGGRKRPHEPHRSARPDHRECHLESNFHAAGSTSFSTLPSIARRIYRRRKGCGGCLFLGRLSTNWSGRGRSHWAYA